MMDIQVGFEGSLEIRPSVGADRHRAAHNPMGQPSRSANSDGFSFEPPSFENGSGESSREKPANS